MTAEVYGLHNGEGELLLEGRLSPQGKPELRLIVQGDKEQLAVFLTTNDIHTVLHFLLSWAEFQPHLQDIIDLIRLERGL